MTLPTDGNAPLSNPSHLTEHQRVSDSLALLNTTPWIALPLSAGWTYFGVPFEQPAYRKVGDVVQLQGLLQGPATSGPSTIATLPAGYRPKRQHVLIAPCSVGQASAGLLRVDAQIDGTITCALTGTAWWLSVSGLWFSTTGL
jgi:hypothetical protein